MAEHHDRFPAHCIVQQKPNSINEPFVTHLFTSPPAHKHVLTSNDYYNKMHFKTIVAFLMLGVQALALPEAEPQRETTTSTTRTGTTTTRTSTTSTSCPTATAIPASLQVITYRQIRCGSNQVNRQGDKPNANQEFVRITSRNSDCRDIESGRQGLDSVSFEVQGTLPANRDCVMQWFTERGCDRGRSRTEFRLTDQNRCFNTRGIRSFRTVCRRRRSD